MESAKVAIRGAAVFSITEVPIRKQQNKQTKKVGEFKSQRCDIIMTAVTF